MRYTKPVVTTHKFRKYGADGKMIRGEDGRAIYDVLFGIRISYLPGSDEMWETFDHPALFRDEKRAERFCEKVDRACGINLRAWVFPGDRCSPVPATDAAFYCPL
jgi:hypothetical protein